MSYYPFSQRINDVYTLTGPSGVSAVFNDPTSPNYAGMLTDVSGFDSSDLREVADELVQQDGGVHGDFWLGRRPISMTGRIFGHATERERALKMDLITRASMALRGDASLTWKPSVRQENLMTNPGFELGVAGWSGVTQISTWFDTGAYSGRITGTIANNDVSAYSPAFPVTPGLPISIRLVQRTAATHTGTGTAPRVIIQWDNGSNAFNLAPTGGAIGSTGSNAASTTTIISGTSVVAPATATQARLRVLANTSGTQTIDFYVDSIVVARGSSVPTSYFDGSMAGFYWQGNPHVSASGDFIEMFIPVRRQQPLRFTGAWTKDFQLQLVSEWATLFASVQQSVSGSGVTVENRGSYPAAPAFRITGASTNPQVTVGSSVLKTTGLTLAGGESLDINTFTHTAVFTAGARNGQSGNSYIDFVGTNSWPALNTGNNTVTLSGGGTLTTFFLDTWA